MMLMVHMIYQSLVKRDYLDVESVTLVWGKLASRGSRVRLPPGLYPVSNRVQIIDYIINCFNSEEKHLVQF